MLADDDLEISNWQDLNKDGMKLAVTQGTTMDIYVTERLDKAEILRFPSNGESVAAFQSGRVNAVSLFHPPLIAMRSKIGRGQIVLPSRSGNPHLLLLYAWNLTSASGLGEYRDFLLLYHRTNPEVV